jgi:hypothetical protein
MSSSVFWAVVRKDIYVCRAFGGAGLLSGLLALGLMATGKIGYAIGGVVYLSALVAAGIMIATYGFMADRKAQSRVFSLTLPISGQHHDLAKVTAAFLTYGVPWIILTAVSVLLLPLSGALPRGYVVYGLLVQGCCMALFSAMVAAMMVANSDLFVGLAVIINNIVFTLAIMILSQPSVSGPMQGSRIVWTDVAVWFLTVEVSLLVVSVLVAISIVLRKRDYL